MTYELYRDAHAIARAIIVGSKGLGYTSIDLEQVLADVYKAKRVSEIGDSYWESLGQLGRAKEKLKAARLLELDESKYENDVEQWEFTVSALREKVQAIVDSCEYSPYRGWLVDAIVIPE